MTTRALIRCVREVDPASLGLISYRYGRHALSALRRDLMGPWVPTTAVLELSYDCNRRCEHCYITPYAGSGSMRPELAEQIVDHLVAHGNIHLVAFLGGEPLTAAHVPLIAAVARRHPTLLFTIATNGDFLAEEGLPPQLATLPNLTYYLSIDGLTERTNDSLRGREAWASVTRAFQVLRQARRFFSASVTVRQRNISEVTGRAFLEFLADRGVKMAFFMRERGARELGWSTFEQAVKAIRCAARGTAIHVRFGSKEDRVALSGHTRLIFNPAGRVRLSKIDLVQGLPRDLQTVAWVDALRKPPWEQQRP